MVTKYKIQYLRKPEDNSKYGKTAEFTNSTTRTNYNIEDEKVKDIKTILIKLVHLQQTITTTTII